MDKFKDEKFVQVIITILGTVLLLLIILDPAIPALNNIVSALFWVGLWRLFYIQGRFPGGIWTFMYALIVVLNLFAAISEIG